MLKSIQETRKHDDTQAGIQASSCGSNRMHGKLRYSCIYRPNTSHRTEHWTERPSTSTIIPDLEDLKLGTNLVCTTLQNCGTDGVGSHVAMGVCGNDQADIQVWCMVFKVGAKEVRVDSVCDV